jgi:outer membrane protein assembly factor BamB
MKQNLPQNEGVDAVCARARPLFGSRGGCVIAAASVLTVIATAVADQNASWPMWGGTPQRNMANPTAKNVATHWDVNPKGNIKWIARVGSRCYGNPVVADGKVFVGTNNAYPRPDGGRGRNPNIAGDKGIVMCFRQSDGEFLWQSVHDKLPAGKENDWPEEGIASTCAVDGKRVYYVSNRCTLVCADTEGFRDGRNDGIQTEKYHEQSDADIIWELDMIGELGVYPHFLATSSPLVVGDLVYVHTSNGPDENAFFVVPEPNAPSFIAVDKHNGKVVWQDSSPGERLLDGQWSSPTYGEVHGKGQVYFPGGDGWLYAFEPLPESPGRAKLIWKFDCNPPGGAANFGGKSTQNAILGTAVFHEDRVFVAVGQNPERGEGPGHLWAIDASRTGDVSEYIGEWDPVTRSKRDPKKNPNSAMVWHYGDRDFHRSMSTVAIQGDLLIAADLSGFVHCLDRESGKPYWKHDMLSSVWGSPSIIDGKVYIGDEDGDVTILKLDNECAVIGEMNMGANVPSTAVAVDGVLYLATSSHLIAIEQK